MNNVDPNHMELWILIVALIILFLVITWVLGQEIALLHEKYDALRSKQLEHDAGFHRVLGWEPDAGGIVRARQEGP